MATGRSDKSGNYSKGFRHGQYCGNSAFDNGDEDQARPILTKQNGNDDQIPRWKGFDYFYDADAIKEATDYFGPKRIFGASNQNGTFRKDIKATHSRITDSATNAPSGL